MMTDLPIPRFQAAQDLINHLTEFSSVSNLCTALVERRVGLAETSLVWCNAALLALAGRDSFLELAENLQNIIIPVHIDPMDQERFQVRIEKGLPVGGRLYIVRPSGRRVQCCYHGQPLIMGRRIYVSIMIYGCSDCSVPSCQTGRKVESLLH